MLLFLGHQWWQERHPHRLVDGYLDDLLFLPVVLGSTAWAVKVVAGVRHWRVPLMWWLPAAVYLVVLVEVGFSRWHEAFTYDPWDFLAYGLGGVLYAWTNARVPSGTRLVGNAST